MEQLADVATDEAAWRLAQRINSTYSHEAVRWPTAQKKRETIAVGAWSPATKLFGVVTCDFAAKFAEAYFADAYLAAALLGSSITLAHGIPVDHVEECGDIVRAAVLIVQVVSVFPDV